MPTPLVRRREDSSRHTELDCVFESRRASSGRPQVLGRCINAPSFIQASFATGPRLHQAPPCQRPGGQGVRTSDFLKRANMPAVPTPPKRGGEPGTSLSGDRGAKLTTT